MAKDKTFFDYATAIQLKTNIEYNDKIANGYMLMLHFSHDNKLLNITNSINEHIFKSTIPNKCIYTYFYDKVPKGKRWIRWVKKNVEKDNKINGLAERYGISKREAAESLL